MSNTQTELAKNPLVNYIFLLRVEAIYDLACTRISGIEQEKEYENIQEGGVNDYVHLREKPVSKSSTLQIERYIGENYLDPLPVGKRLSTELVLYVSRYLNNFDNATMIFRFDGCIVTGKEYGELDAEKGGLMVEKTKIAYERVTVERVQNDVLQTAWKFDKSGKKYQGVGKRHAIYTEKEMRKSEMEKKSRKWPQRGSAKTLRKVVSQSEMEKTSRKWPKQRSAKTIENIRE